MFKYLERHTDFLGFLIFILFFSGAHAQKEAELKRFEYSHSSMGTLFTIIGYGSDSLHARETVMAAFSMIDHLNLIMSDYNPESELMKLCRKSGEGTYIPVSSELFQVIRESLHWSEWSGGIFDITIGPYSQLWRRAGRKDILPDSAQIKKIGNLVGYQFIKLDTPKQAVLLSRPGMQLDLGGIAKGYTVDKIYKFLKENGYDMVLVDGGGDIRVGNKPPTTDGWKVRIMGGNGSDSILVETNCAIATSGDLYRFTEIDGKRYSHIINPFTGYGISTSRTVTVIAPDCSEADVLASILSITGADKGFQLLGKREEVKVFMLELDNEELKEFSYP